MKVKLKDIKPSPKPIRSSWDEEAMETLKESIAKEGLIIPIKVRPINGKYEVVYGHRRLEAMRRLGWKECEAIIEGMEPQTALVQSIVENVEREDLNDVDLGEALKAYREMMGHTSWEQVARDFGHTADWAAKRARVVEKPPEVKQLITEGRITAEHVEAVETGLREHLPAGAPKEEMPEIERAVLQKVADEDLGKRTARKVAETVAKTDKATREAILKTRWVRGAEEVIEEIAVEEVREERERREIAEEKKIRWERFPSTKDFLEILRMHQRLIKRGWEAAKDEKIAPDHLHYLTQRMKETVQILQDIIEQMEAKALERY